MKKLIVFMVFCGFSPSLFAARFSCAEIIQWGNDDKIMLQMPTQYLERVQLLIDKANKAATGEIALDSSEAPIRRALSEASRRAISHPTVIESLRTLETQDRDIWLLWVFYRRSGKAIAKTVWGTEGPEAEEQVRERVRHLYLVLSESEVAKPQSQPSRALLYDSKWLQELMVMSGPHRRFLDYETRMEVRTKTIENFQDWVRNHMTFKLSSDPS